MTTITSWLEEPSEDLEGVIKFLKMLLRLLEVNLTVYPSGESMEYIMQIVLPLVSRGIYLSEQLAENGEHFFSLLN